MEKPSLESVPFWCEGCEMQEYPALDQDLSVDVCIIGAGISGLTAAFLLCKEGKKVVVLDDGVIAGGQTMRTTGHLSSILDNRFSELERYFGEKGVDIAIESHGKAIDLIGRIIKHEKIECDFQIVNAYLFANSKKNGIEEIEKEYFLAKKAGAEAVLVERAPLSSFDTGKALCFSNQAHFHPLKYVTGLARSIVKANGKIYCGTHVTKIHKKSPYLIETDQIKSVKADHVIIATNSPIHNRFFPHLKQASYRTYVIGGKIPKGSIANHLYYDTHDPYHYVRLAYDSKGHEFLIIGGEDHRTGEERHIKSRYSALERWSRHRFPELKEISYRWSGQIIDPIDGLAFIGRAEKDRELYLITGDSGNGLTHGTLGAILITDLICGRENPWEKLYSPHRITLKACGSFLEENLNSLWQYKDWLSIGEKKRLRNNSGIVIRKGLKKCALYKDKEGTIHEMTAICPHLGAIVNWNDEEHCWECPAHGSRFDATGRVIQGPANCNLKIS